MSLSDKLAQPKSTNARCSIGVLISDVTDLADKAALIKALRDPSWGHKALQRVLLTEGHEVSLRSLERHRRGECKCLKK
jgi:hypothetical protein